MDIVATIVVAAVVVAVVALVVVKLARDKKKNGHIGCDCGGCGGCPNHELCHNNKKH